MSSKAEALEKQYEAAVEHVLDIAEKNSPVRVKAEFIGCKNCGSKLAKKYIKVYGKACKCPLCGSSLFSKTAQERIQKASEKAKKIKAEWQKELEKEEAASKPTFAEALRDTRDRFDYILEENKTPNFVEIVGKIGGDVLTFRIYRDGNVYEK